MTAPVPIFDHLLRMTGVISFSGFVFGRASGGYHGWHRGYRGSEMGPDGSMDDCPMMRPGGIGPGGMMGPQQSPSTAPPTSLRP